MRSLFVHLLLFAAATAGPGLLASDPVILADGERLEFRVGWGIFAHAGTITVAAEEEVMEGLPQTRVTTETSTRGTIRVLYPFDGRVESIFDQRTGRLLAAFATTRSSRKTTQASIVFDYGEGIARYVDCLRPERSTEVEIPEGFPKDLITTLINARTWDLELGESREISVLFDDEFYDLIVTAERIETVKIAQGKRETLLLVPRMQGEPKGMFRRGGQVRVWISQDDDRLPLRLQVAMPVGTATAVLTDYRPPNSPSFASLDADTDPARRRTR